VPKDGYYRLDIVYSNGAVDENGKRVSATQKFFIDGNEQEEIVYPSSIKYEHSSCVSRTVFLEKGKHTLRLAHSKYSAGLDFIDITETDESSDDIFVQKDYNISDETETAYLISAPKDGFYEVDLSFSSGVTDKNLLVNSVAMGKISAEENAKAIIFLRRGISFIEVDGNELSDISLKQIESDLIRFSLKDFRLNGCKIQNGFIENISSENKNSASLSVNCPQTGVYALTVAYSNDGECGIHDYNVDIIEKYASISVNGKSIGNIYFRNTYSLDTVKTKTVYVELEKGLNEITFANDGSYKFNGVETFAPEIKEAAVAKAFCEVKND
jgi:hypothetical protein